MKLITSLKFAVQDRYGQWLTECHTTGSAYWTNDPKQAAEFSEAEAAYEASQRNVSTIEELRYKRCIVVLHPNTVQCPMNLNDLAIKVHAVNLKWWQNLDTGEPLKRNKAELLALIHSEISEALEGERKNLMDDKLPHRRMAEVELADALIRILDYAAGFGYDLQGAFDEKMAYNSKREDHKHEATRIAVGKQF